MKYLANIKEAKRFFDFGLGNAYKEKAILINHPYFVNAPSMPPSTLDTEAYKRVPDQPQYQALDEAHQTHS